MTTRLLLASEHPIVRQELRTFLEKEPDFLVAAEVDTGEAAVRSALAVKPDVIILDLAMSKGPDPVHQLMAAVPTAKVICLSMHADRRLVLEVLKAGAIGYVLKEHAFEELTMAIRAVQARKTYITQSLFDAVIQDYIELLRGSEVRFRTIFESFSIGIALMDGKSRIVESNQALQVLLGYSQEELLHKELSEFFPPEEAAKCKNYFKDLAAGKPGPHLLEAEYRRKDGSLSWGRLSVSSFQGAGREGQVAISLLEDINDRKQAEDKIQDYQQKLLSVARELSLAEETERRRLANGFHDDVGQLLALVQIKLGSLRQAVSADQTESLDEIRQILGQTIRSVRSLGGELSPPVLYELGFDSAIEWFAEKLQEQHGIKFTVAADHNPQPMDDEVRVFLFHLMRDLLTNIVKFVKPNNVSILIDRTDADMRITIENDWGGAESPMLSPDGPWIFSIRERLRYLGGSLEVEFGPEQKTRMTLMVSGSHLTKVAEKGDKQPS
jgi:PAS domain S-box-containing protein